MSREKVFHEIVDNIVDILPELKGREIKESDSLKEIGANSIDRADIIMSTLERLDRRIPMVDFGNAKNIGEIISVILGEGNDGNCR